MNEEVLKNTSGIYTKSQWIIFCVLGITNLLTYMLYSMQAPIFPAEAQRKNASATEFGLVFGSFELTQLIMSPIVGIYAPKIGILRVFNTGILVTGISTILFGYLQFVNTHWMFITGAFILRIIESIGATAVCVTIYTFVAIKFPESMAKTMGAMEGIVGLAFSIGPFVGSALYQVGGFFLPFNVIGGALLGIGGVVYFLLQNISQMNPIQENLNEKKKNGLFSLLKNVPTIYFYISIVGVGATNVGFLLTLLEVHLQQFDLTPIYIGLVFLLLGVSYATSAPIFSWVCGAIKIPELVPLTGIILYIIGWTLIGPAPFITLKPSIPLAISAVIIMGCAGGCVLSSGFILSVMAAESSSFSDPSKTSSHISGLWLAGSSFGAFIGPIIAGVLYDFLNFPLASLSMVELDAIQIIFLLIFIIFKKSIVKKPSIEVESPELIHLNSNCTNGIGRISEEMKC